jgi:outer membrane receptor for ferrienterochelin and colicin
MKKAMNNITNRWLWVGIILTILSVNAQSEEPKDFSSMSLEELMNVQVSTSTLTGTTRRTQPATVTTIDKEEIRRSGARSLDELLLIYVPNLQQWMDIHWPTHLGLRGINADRDDKYLILVNGRVMNERSSYGALSERDLPMLGDIERIEVIRGGGSALYGPGAIAMVINITTENYKTFKGSQVTGRLGAIEEHYTGEYKHTWDLGPDEGLYFYTGISRYLGADGDDATTYAADWYDRRNPSSAADMRHNPLAYPQHSPDYHESFRPNRPKVKLFADYTKEDLDLWLRFTQGGTTWVNGQSKCLENGGMGYQQLTVYGKQLFELTSDLNFELDFSYDIEDIDYIKAQHVCNPKDITPTAVKSTSDNYSYSEQEYFTKGLFRWDINEDHHLAFGAEYVYNLLGRDGYGYPSRDEATGNGPAELWGSWEDSLSSLVGEYQWNITDVWTVFLGGRADKHTYTGNMYSPRGAVVYTPTAKDTLKFMFTRSTRTNLETYLKQNDHTNHTNATPELTDNYEIRYERQQTDKFFLGGGFFFQDRQPIQWANGTNGPLGNIRAWGLEGEMAYRAENWRLTLSHSFTKMYDNELPGTGEIVSASGYGVGNDYAQWNDHCTKLIATWFVDDKLSLDASLQGYWGSNGAEDYIQVRTIRHEAPPPVGKGWNMSGHKIDSEIYNYSVFLNLGVEYKWSKNTLLRLDLYNVLGWLEDELNAIPFMYNGSQIGQQMQLAPAAVGVTLQHNF